MPTPAQPTDRPLILPPASLPAGNAPLLARRAFIDYRHHPAYAALIDSATSATRLAAWRVFVRAWLLTKLKRAIQYELIPLHVRRAGGTALLRAALANALRRRQGRVLSLDGADLSPLDLAFRRHGCAVVRMTDAEFDGLRTVSQAHFDALAAQRAQTLRGPREFEASRAYASRDQSARLFEVIEAVFTACGVLATASAYLGRPARLVDVNPQINDASDDFWRRIFPDGAATPPATAYLHRDASGGDLKAIIYLSDVGADNGPFGYVIGSHTIAPLPADDHICETNDANGLAATDPESRRLFAALPESWRQKGAVGNDLIDGTAPSRALLDSLWSIAAPRGSTVLFDTKGMHRGGMVTVGERRVITCVIG
jgi:hypothetical protein